MNHGIRHRKFSRRSEHRNAMLVNIAKELIEHESVITTLPKAKEVRSVVERMVTMGKAGGLHDRRRLLARCWGDEKIVHKVFTDLAKRYSGRPGGYVRVVKTGFRKGDCAPMSVIQFV